MYFSNITNEELQHFHEIVGADFSMSLTDVLKSNLFEVEQIIENKIYRIFPFFYCKKIISSNPNDRIMNTNCLILQKNDRETYLSFITDESKHNVVFNENFHDIKGITDILTMDEFNAIVYRLRQNGSLHGDLNFEEKSSIVGTYATYQFNNVEGQLRNDSGIIVNDKVKNNPITVKLTNPFFINARYTLTFTVFSITGANVCEENKRDFISKDTFSIDLIEDSDVAISLSDYVNDSILDFDVSVSISFDVPEIVNSDFNLVLSVDKNNINIGDKITLTAKLSGKDNVGNYTVQFFEDSKLIANVLTNKEGVANLVHTPNTLGNHLYSAKTLGLTSEVNVDVNKFKTTLSLQVNKDKIVYGDEIVLMGTLLVDNKPINDLPIKIYNNNNLIDTLKTNEMGLIRFASSKLNTGNNNLKLVYDGSSIHTPCSASVMVVVAIPTQIKMEYATPAPIYASETVYEVKGVLYNSIDNTPIANKTVIVTEDGSDKSTEFTTNGNGAFKLQKTFTAGNRSLKMIYQPRNFDIGYYTDASYVHKFEVIKQGAVFKDIVKTESAISGHLIQSGTGKTGVKKSILVKYDTDSVSRANTDDKGYFKITIEKDGVIYKPKSWNKLICEEDDRFNATEYDISNIPINYNTFIVNLGKVPDTPYFVCWGRLVDANGNGIGGKYVDAIDTVNKQDFTLFTHDKDDIGVFGLTTSFEDHSFKCTFKGDGKYKGCNGVIG